jgi:ATP-dependent exoDNAse (exonuclease V) beta subunit
MPFEAQPLPYRIEAPSELADSALYAQVNTPTLPSTTLKGKSFGGGEGEAETAEHAAMRGTITHRLIQTLWHHGELPETERISTALAAEGMNPDTAAAVAKEIADEVTACQKEPFFQWLLDSTSSDGESEYALEAVGPPGVIQTGILDFVKQDGDVWWVVDFKTSHPVAGQTKADFLKQQGEYYLLQLKAYQSMLAKAKEVDIAQIRAGLYFTSLQQWYEIEKER